jgi:hypothetical protein
MSGEGMNPTILRATLSGSSLNGLLLTSSVTRDTLILTRE